MESSASTLPSSEDEIASLVRQLEETQRRLQELAGGEVDSVMHPGGRAYLLHDAQEKLRESEKLYHSLFENMLEGYAYCELVYEGDLAMDYIYKEINRAFEPLTGLKNVVGKKVSELVPGIHQANPEQLELYSRVAKTGKPEKFETHTKLLGNWFSVSAYSHKPGYFAIFFENITEQKSAEALRTESEGRYRSLVEATAAMVWAMPSSGTFETEQPAWTAFTGQSFEEHRGWGWLNAIHPDDQDETSRVWARALETRSIYELEHRVRAADQSYHHMMVRAVPMLGEDGAIREWVGVHTDITERKKIEQQFLRSQRMDGIGTLAGGIAHDLNNSLAPILMSLELLKMSFPDEASQRLLTIVSESAQRGADMVRQLLSFARGVEGRRVALQIAHLMREIAKIATDTFLKHIHVQTFIPSDLWTVLGDATQLHQVLLNLCINARDAMPEGGILTLSAENVTLDKHYAGLHLEAHAGPYVCIQIQDSGIGMPPEVVEKIFDPFYTTKELGKGTGLGLSTTLGIVKSHSGFIRVYSEPGKGTKFSIYLPAQPEPAETLITLETEMPCGHGELILVLDDELFVRQITQQTLEAFGYRVALASEGTEAIAIYALRGKEISVMLTDMMMPGLDGPATIHVINQMNSKLPIIAASGLATEAQIAKATSLGVKYFLPKPYTAEALLKILHQILANSR